MGCMLLCCAHFASGQEAAIYMKRGSNATGSIEDIMAIKALMISPRNYSVREEVDDCKLLVAYDFTYVTEPATQTTEVEKKRDEVWLEVGAHTNRYYSRNGEYRDSVDCEYMTNMDPALVGRATDGSDYPKLGFADDVKSLYIDVFTYPESDERLVSTRLGNTDHQYTEKIDKLDWHFSTQRDSVLGYDCFVAEAEFRGRKWRAWFTTEIPMNYGPWKLCGLPGLILKAEDSEGHFSWEAIGLMQPEDHNIYSHSTELKPAWNTYKYQIKKSTRKNVAKLWEVAWVMPFAFIRSEINLVSLKIDDQEIDFSRRYTDIDTYFPRLELDY